MLSRNIGRRLSKSTFHLIFSFQFSRVVVCVRVCVVTCVMVQLTEIIAGSAEKKEKKKTKSYIVQPHEIVSNVYSDCT